MTYYLHETGTMIGRGGMELFIQSWTVDRPRGALVIAHGLGEHSGRYSHLIDWLKGKQISVYGYDQRGHGKSAGKRGHVLSFAEYVQDLSIYISMVRDLNEGIPLFLLGHSMGGIIAMLYALESPETLAGLVLSSPGLMPTVEAPRAKVKIAAFLSRYLPGVLVSNEIDATQISHDRDIVASYTSDPLNHDRISLRWYTEFIESGLECLRRAPELALPLLVTHGTEDRMVDFTGSIRLHDGVSSRDRTIRLFEGLYHETMNEVEFERVKVLDAIGKWILERSGGVKRQGKTAAGSGKKKVKKKVPEKSKQR